MSNLAQLAANAGFTGNDLVTAVAIALAESNGNPNAYNPETQAGTASGQGSYGLWQIYSAAHPQYSTADLLDPQGNANAAYGVFSAAGGFSPWSTYNSGAYQNYLSQAAELVGSTGIPVPSIDMSASTGIDLGSWTPSVAELLTMLGVGAAVTLFLLMR